MYDYGDDWTVLLKLEKVLRGAVNGETAGDRWAPWRTWRRRRPCVGPNFNEQPEDEPFDVAELDELVADWAS